MCPSPRIKRELSHESYFVTITVLDWVDVFTSTKYFSILADSLRFCMQEKGLILYEYVFMTNHIHLLARAGKEGIGLDKILRDFKCFTTKEVYKAIKKDHRNHLVWNLIGSKEKKKINHFQLWQENNCPILIQSERFFRQKAEYIWNNPVKKGYVFHPEEWLYSSARQRLNKNNLTDLPLLCTDYEG